MVIPPLDLKGLRCPLPALRTAKALRALPPGARLIVETTDPLAGLDIPHLCRSEGHRLVEQSGGPDGHCFVIERGDGAPVAQTPNGGG